MGSTNSADKTSSPVQHLKPTNNKTQELQRGKITPRNPLILSRKMNQKEMGKHLIQRVESRELKVVGVW